MLLLYWPHTFLPRPNLIVCSLWCRGADQWLGKLEDDRRMEVREAQQQASANSGDTQPASTHTTLLYSLTGNVVIMGAKFYAFSRTGSSAMFSEAVHTLVRRQQRAPSRRIRAYLQTRYTHTNSPPFPPL